MPSKALEDEAERLGKEVWETQMKLNELRLQRTRLWYRMYHGHNYLQRGIATLNNRQIPESAWVGDDGVEKAIRRFVA